MMKQNMAKRNIFSSKFVERIYTLNILASLCTCQSFLDIKELSSMQYGVTLTKIPVILEQAPVETIMHLSSIHGQAYSCKLPEINISKNNEKSTEQDTSNMISKILDKSMNGTCLIHNQGWWSYKVCHKEKIEQYHIGDKGEVEGVISLLGVYEREDDWQHKDISQRRSGNLFHNQTYVNGSVCDLTATPRKTTVQYFCSEGKKDNIIRVEEPSTCEYLITIHSMELCSHPLFKVEDNTKHIDLVCSPALTINNYNRYLDKLIKDKGIGMNIETSEQSNKLLSSNVFGMDEISTNQKHSDRKLQLDMEYAQRKIDVSKEMRSSKNLLDSLINRFKSSQTDKDREILRTMIKDLMSNIEAFERQIRSIEGRMNSIKELETELDKKFKESSDDISKRPSLTKPILNQNAQNFRNKDKERLENRNQYKMMQQRETYVERNEDMHQKVSYKKENNEEVMQRNGDYTEKDNSETSNVVHSIHNKNEDLSQLLTSFKDVDTKPEKPKMEKQKDITKENQLKEVVNRRFNDVVNVLKNVINKKKIMRERGPKTDIAIADSEKQAKKEYTDMQDNIRTIDDITALDNEPDDLEGKNEEVSMATRKIEDAVKKQLQDAGFNLNANIKIKIVTSKEKFDMFRKGKSSNILSDNDASSLKDLLADFLGNNQEKITEEKRHRSMEENYHFRWNEDDEQRS